MLLVFIIYVIGIQNIKLYADDTVIFMEGDDVSHLQNNIQKLLNRFSYWCEENKLSINTDKTKLVCFGTKQRVKTFTKK